MTDPRIVAAPVAVRNATRALAWLLAARRVHDRDLAGGAVRRRREPALPGRHRPAPLPAGSGPWIATAYGPPWDADERERRHRHRPEPDRR